MKFLNGRVELMPGDCLDVLRTLPDNHVDSVVTDPPYGLEFMGKDWDSFDPKDRKNASVWNGRRQGQSGWEEQAANRSGKGGGGPSYKAGHKGAKRCALCGKRAFSGSPCECDNPEWVIEHRQEAPSVMLGFQSFSEAWAREVYRVLKPGGHLLSFSGSRTYHRMVCAIEDAGYADTATTGRMMPLQEGGNRDGYLDITAPATDLARQWQGWGTALKPSHEPLVWAQKPLRLVPALDILAESTAYVEALLWSIAPARLVERLFELSQSGSGAVQSGGVRWIAAVHHGIGSLAPSELTDMFSSPEQASTFLSIASLWSAILGASSERLSTSTTSTSASLTTGLRTLWCSTSETIPESTIKAAIQTDGTWWNAETAEMISSAQPRGLSDIQTGTSARGSATWRTGDAVVNGLAAIAESSFSHLRVIRDNSADPVAITRAESSEREISPAHEPIVVARKPLSGTVAANVAQWGTGALNIDGCRVATSDKLGGGGEKAETAGKFTNEGWRRPWMDDPEASEAFAAKVRANVEKSEALGRFPANLIHDGSDEVLEVFAAFGERRTSGNKRPTTFSMGYHGGSGDDRVPIDHCDGGTAARFFKTCNHDSEDERSGVEGHAEGVGSLGTASAVENHWNQESVSSPACAQRFYYTSKADTEDRLGSSHPTVKPLSLMRYLVRLVTPPGGLVLDPFAGTGTTGQAAYLEGMSAVLIEREAEYQADIARRMELVLAGPDERSRAIHKQKLRGKPQDFGPLFGLPEAAE
jgi:hypothetical protein